MGIEMTTAVKKYNPGFLSDEEVIDSFCVRTTEFESIVESLRENNGNSNPHTIVIGPRGIGKTHLLMRVAAQVRNDESLNGYFPITFPEESYEVSTCGEFWLECLDHLAHQAPEDERDNLTRTHEDVSSETNDRVLAQRCLGALLDFADRQQKRLLLVVENLNMLFADVRDADEVGWQLRATLQTEPRVMLLASATSRFDEIDNADCALYDIFRTFTLRPLNTEECAALWRLVSGSEVESDSVRPIEIFTGGNPRLITIIATFGADRPFQELMENLLGLVDDHTEYFKSHLEHLPPQERRVYLALARLWKPATTQEVASLARIGTSQCSAQLNRLVERGAVMIEGGTPRRRQFYLTERLYNIYYLLRRGSGTQQAVEKLIEFMIAWYSPQELLGILEQTQLEAQSAKVPPPDIFWQFTTIGLDAITELMRQDEFEKALEICNALSQAPAASGLNETQSVKLASASMRIDLQIGLGHIDEAMADADKLNSMCANLEDAITNEERLFWEANARRGKGSALIASLDLVNGIDVLDQALELYESLRGNFDADGIELIVAGIRLVKSIAYLSCNDNVMARSTLELLIGEYLEKMPLSANELEVVGRAIGVKSVILAESGITIDEAEFAIWIDHVVRFGFDQIAISALTSYIAISGPTVALEKMRKSPAADVFAPAVAALQQELGQTPRVAKEVDEVAKDIRRELVEVTERLGVEWPPSEIVEVSR